MSSTHNHCFSHHHYQAWCHQIFFVNNTKIFVTSSVLKLQKWFLHQNGVESNQESKSDMYKLLGGVWRCVSYQKMCSRWLLAWYRHLAWLDIVAHCAVIPLIAISSYLCSYGWTRGLLIFILVEAPPILTNWPPEHVIDSRRRDN